MAAAEALDTAAARLEDVVQSARLAGSALDGVSGSLTDRMAELVSWADEVRSVVVRARDALMHAGAR